MPRIVAPTDVALDELCARLRELAPTLDTPGAWPAQQLRLCAEAGVHEWFLPRNVGGQGWSEADLLRGYLKLSAACLTTAFILTQRVGACTRIAASGNAHAIERLLPPLLRGEIFATVGISHLTTSRQHVKPVLQARETDSGFELNGFSPWVTGAEHAQAIVLGATLDDGRQILGALPTDLAGVRIPQAPDLVSLTASRTGPPHSLRQSAGRARVASRGTRRTSHETGPRGQNGRFADFHTRGGSINGRARLSRPRIAAA